MMNKYNFRILLYGIFVILATFGITFLAAGAHIFGEERFWFVFGPLLLGEVVVFYPWLRLSGRSSKTDFPARVATAYLPSCYLLFTVLMLIAYPAGASSAFICILQIIGLAAATGVFLLLSFLTDAIKGNDAVFTKADAPRTGFRADFAAFGIILQKRFAGDRDFAHQLTALENRIRWASESVPGSESLDNAAAEKIAEIARAAGEKSKEEITMLLQEAETALIQREETIKIIR